MKTFTRLAVAGVIAIAALQLVRPSIPSKPATAQIQAPPEVKRILEKDCYSCHSDQLRLAWFDQIVPGYWLVRHDILNARAHLDFSTLGSKPAPAQKATLYEAVNMIQLGAMPLPSFRQLHPEANVTPDELATLKSYLAPWSSALIQPGAATGTTTASPGPKTAENLGNASGPLKLETVQPELNEFPFDPDFENWKPIAITDRGDNNTLRFILGNDIAFRAAQSGDISPWPDGAQFAKIAWQQEHDAEGLVRPGKFIQVELMLKQADRYRSTEGWGWGRWRGLDLKPYGKDSHFVNECTSCHLPVRGDDYVYTLPITPAKVNRDEVLNNRAAALPASLPYQLLAWRAITMYVDPQNHTMATLFGNDLAMRSVQARGESPASGPAGPVYSSGAVLALITWAQRDDPHWFGARIPDMPRSVEFVQVAGDGQTNSYRRFAGSALTEDHSSADVTAQRMNFLLGLPPARLP